MVGGSEVFLCVPQGSVAQLREVWEETDGLDPQEFNPKTFFKLHGQSLPSRLVLDSPLDPLHEFASHLFWFRHER